jgi:hypothetical protein
LADEPVNSHRETERSHGGPRAARTARAARVAVMTTRGRRLLVGSSWTAVASLPPLADAAPTACGERHFTVEAVTRAGRVTLRAILTGRRIELERAELDDRARFVPGWRSVDAPA